MQTLKFDVFGRLVLVAESGDGWTAFYLGAEGKKRPATDIVVPADIPESEIGHYLGDPCHEWATAQHPNVKRLDYRNTVHALMHSANNSCAHRAAHDKALQPKRESDSARLRRLISSRRG